MTLLKNYLFIFITLLAGSGYSAPGTPLTSTDSCQPQMPLSYSSPLIQSYISDLVFLYSHGACFERVELLDYDQKTTWSLYVFKKLPQIPTREYGPNNRNFSGISIGSPGYQKLEDFFSQPNVLVAIMPEGFNTGAMYSTHDNLSENHFISKIRHKLKLPDLNFVLTLSRIPTTQQLNVHPQRTPIDVTIAHEIYHYEDFKSGRAATREQRLAQSLNNEAPSNFDHDFNNTLVVLLRELGAMNAGFLYGKQSNVIPESITQISFLRDRHTKIKNDLPLVNENLKKLSTLNTKLQEDICELILNSFDQHFLNKNVLKELFPICQ